MADDRLSGSEELANVSQSDNAGTWKRLLRKLRKNIEQKRELPKLQRRLREAPSGKKRGDGTPNMAIRLHRLLPRIVVPTLAWACSTGRQ
jgi:hypothetical protein